MDTARWEKIQSLFHLVADLPRSEQNSFLEEACGQDETLRVELLGMLREDGQSNSLLDSDVSQVAQRIFGDSSLPPAQQFGPYQIKRLLGEGGMGVVYLAERGDLGSQVAIKVLRDAWLSPARRERFASEQRTLAQLNHPSIARLYDADTLADGTPWFVMEYVEGVPLTDYCREHKCPVKTRLQLFRSVCEAVQYAHQHAVIHRDLKPSNILVKGDGSVRLLDFGIAKQLDSLDGAADRTRTSMRLMTPAYAAPEQIRGGDVGLYTDVYALGVVLYELLAGQLPFDLSKVTPGEAVSIVADHEPAKPSVVAKRPGGNGRSAFLPSASAAQWADLDVLCLTAMHRDVRRRYPSAEALIRDLDRYLNGEPLEARPDSLSYRAGKFVRRHHRSVAAAAIVALLVIGLVVFFTLRLAKARDVAQAEAARTQRIQAFMLNLFKGGNEDAGPPGDMRVVSLLDRGVLEAQSLNGEPDVQAELYLTLGSIYQKLGKFDRADMLEDFALEQRTKLYGEDNRYVAESLVALAQLRSDEAKFEEAERFARDGLDMSKRNLPPNHPEVARATSALGKVLEGRGKYDEAIKFLEEAVRLQEASGNATPDLSASLSELANTHFYAGHYDICESLNQRVLAMQRQMYGDHHPLVADTLINLGAIQFQLGNFASSEQYDRQALDIVRSWYGNDNPETASTMTMLGQSLTFQQRYKEATEMLQQSLAILERIYGPRHYRVAYALNELGNVAIREGNLDEAENYYQRELDTYRAVYGDRHYRIGIAESNLGGVYVERKDYPRAEQMFREALQVYSQTLSPNHLSVGISRIRLGTALLGEGRFQEAQQESQAGYEILMKQTSPTLKWVQIARQDLVQEYLALKEPAKAAKFKAELGESSQATTAARK